jgi:hypothetical protein
MGIATCWRQSWNCCFQSLILCSSCSFSSAMSGLIQPLALGIPSSSKSPSVSTPSGDLLGHSWLVSHAIEPCHVCRLSLQISILGQLPSVFVAHLHLSLSLFLVAACWRLLLTIISCILVVTHHYFLLPVFSITINFTRCYFHLWLFSLTVIFTRCYFHSLLFSLTVIFTHCYFHLLLFLQLLFSLTVVCH